ncbi:5'-3' exoribonuclease 1, partial [Stegodyphus mimosarum]
MLGFATLKTLRHSATLRNEKVKVFQSVSQKENMMLTIKEPKEGNMEKIAKDIIGKTIYVGWPHLREAMVISVADGKVKFSFEKNKKSGNLNIKEEEMSLDEEKIWLRQVESVEEHCYQRWGIFVGAVDFLVHVKCCTGVKYILTEDGEVREDKQWEGTLSNYAIQMTVRNVEAFSPDVKCNKNVVDIFSPGLTIFVLSPQFYGNLGTIIDIDDVKNKGSVLVDIESTSEPDLQHIIQKQFELTKEKFMPGYYVAQQLGVDSHFISRITGTFLVQTSPKGSTSPNRVNIGLNLKFNRKNEEVQGFSKKKDDKWLYSEEAVKTLNAYLIEFGDFFEKLLKFIRNDVVYLEDIYPDGKGYEIINKITKWLKSQPCVSAERQECGMKKLDVGIVFAIEQWVQTGMKSEEVYHMKKFMKPHQLYSPFLNKGVSLPDPTVTFELFDRVVNVSHSSSVPLGLKGTIIGIRSAEKESDFMYEILFDKDFFGGLHIGCSSPKAYRLPPNSLINISHGERLKKKCYSPKNIIPRLHKNNLFDSAVRQLKSEVPSPPFQVLQKKQPSLLQSKPFYKADSENFQSQPGILHTADQPFSSNLSGIPVSDMHFVTPKASPASGGCNNNTKIAWRKYPNSSQTEYQTSPLGGGFDNNPKIMTKDNCSSPQSDYRSFWADLKKKAPESSPTKNVPNSTYCCKLSVEELFQYVQDNTDSNQEQNMYASKRTPPVKNQSSHIQATDLLLRFCAEKFGMHPTYSYNNYGNTNLVIATLRLPNGENVTSNPFPTKHQAMLNAAEKALAFLNSMKIHQNCLNNSIPQEQSALLRPLIPPQTYQPDFRFMLYPPPTPNPSFPAAYAQNSGFPPPPFFPPYAPACFEAPLLRHPQPAPPPSIPDSFVKANQMLLLDPQLPYPVKQNSSPAKINSSAVSSEDDVIHFPDGGTATARGGLKSSQKICSDISSTNMFVPGQVMKQARKSPHSAVNFSDEWPALSAKKEENLPKKCATEVHNFCEERTKSYSEVSKSSVTLSSNANSKSSNSPTRNLQVLKSKPK